MNERGLRILARETAEQIRKNAEAKITRKMHVHVKGVPRKQEIKALQNTKKYKAALEELLSADALYQDCKNLNMQPGSLLVQKYMEDEEAYDAVAGECKKRITSAARRYKRDRELRFLKSCDIDLMIAEVRGRVIADFVKSMKSHLLSDRLEVPMPASGSSWHWASLRPVPVTPDTYDDFADHLAAMDEQDFLAFAGYEDAVFGGLLERAIEERHSEIADLGELTLMDVRDSELVDSGEELFWELKEHFSGKRLFDLVSRNKHLREEFVSLRMLRTELSGRVPEHMPDLFPAARRMDRHFIIHIGPTNSGKTYSSVERLKTAARGIYLGPLRLLAFEQYQKLNEQGFLCSLYTGEEHQLVPGACLQASTIEMADEYAKYDVAVIDEAQMVADRERGWAWTTAILGLRADEIHVCIAPHAEKIITALIGECGDSYEIVRHERQTPLVRDEAKFRLSKEYIRKHDALIVFSRRNVHAIAGELRSMGISCSVIYGNLPYDVRQEEARRFREGETDVVVATDAIGMGMNLPIERLVFLEISKFDGVETRLLRPAEIQQIVGRAGRRGIYEKGLWNALEGKDFISDAIDVDIPQIDEVYVGFPESLISIEGKLSSIISEWRNIAAPEGYIISELTHEYALCRYLEEKTDDKWLIYRLITIPFDEDDKDIRLLWDRLSSLIIDGGTADLESMKISPPYKGLSLTEAEQLYKQYDLAYAFTERFGVGEDSETVLQYKKELSEIIAEILKTSKLPFKTCSRCGRKLRWNYPFGICEECYSRTHGRRRHWDKYY